jgi:hypothetical protein
MARGWWRNGIGALGMAMGLVLAAPAQAVFFSSSFDPLGPVSFTGTGLFEFDDECLTPGFTVYTAAECHLRLDHADVTVTDDGAGGTASVHFGSNTASMVDLVIDDGNLIGVDTNLIGPAFTNVCTPQTGCTNIDWWIQWRSGFDEITLAALNDPVFLGRGCDIEEGCDTFGIAPNVTFARVPEPATLALLLGGFGALWVTRRRRRR